MGPVSAWPAIFAIAVVVATSFILKKRFGEPPTAGRFATIDGLRGFLAFFVFLHHSCIWYFYLRTGKWEVPPSNLYTHFGESSVALFFMITGFLFFTKLIDGKFNKIDWAHLYVSRFLRLVPMYFFVVILLFVIVFIISNGVVKESVPRLIFEMIQWLGFTMFGGPNLNGIENTGIIVAGVTWSLPFEWTFYFLLPLLGLAVKVFPPASYLCIAALGVSFMIWHQSFNYLIFLGGIIAAFLVRFEWICRAAQHRYLSFVALIFLFGAIFGFSSAYRAFPLIFLTIFFVIIAAGNSLFGMLSNSSSRTLGEFAYSIYLMHGIFLFVTFNFILGLPYSRTLSAVEHWSVVVGIAPVLIFTCFLTFRFIENPAMQQTKNLTALLRSFFCRTKVQIAR